MKSDQYPVWMTQKPRKGEFKEWKSTKISRWGSPPPDLPTSSRLFRKLASIYPRFVPAFFRHYDDHYHILVKTIVYAKTDGRTTAITFFRQNDADLRASTTWCWENLLLVVVLVLELTGLLFTLWRHSFHCALYRGYYMAAWRYEISLRVLKKRNFVSPSGHVMFYLLYKHQWNAKPFYPAKGAIYYVAIATVIFSHVKITWRVKISCFRAKAHLVFHWWLYNKISLIFFGCNCGNKCCPFSRTILGQHKSNIAFW